MVASQFAVTPCLYQLRIVLRDISPLIWRRLWVRSDTCIADFHAVLQILMDWSDTHLHRFRIHGKDYGIARLGGIGFVDDPRQVRLADFRLHRGERFLYEYNFHDGWMLEIRLEARLALASESNDPICTAGRRAAPPEACGGAWAYLAQRERHDDHPPWEALETVAAAVERFLDTGDRSAMGDRDALRAAMARLETYTEFQPEQFNRQAINARLRQWASGEGGEV